MRIIFVRHGHPDYEKDCLTPLGHRQARAAAERLKGEGIERIFSSPMGRARETAAYTAQALGLEVTALDFMHEIRWGAVDGEPIAHDGHPWNTALDMVGAQEDLLRPDWADRPPFDRNRATGYAKMIAREMDDFMASLGYAREGLYYRVTGQPYGTVAVFSHGGSSSAMLSRLFNLPFPFVCASMPADFTSVTVVSLSKEQGALVAPQLELFADAAHIRNADKAEISFGL
ncbi:MAG: histidine phosphatase family protein [Clostridia bacterium]|nr:histidine phosphatase family protein [Clostridia bacterium]